MQWNNSLSQRGTAEETIQRFDEWGINKGVLLSVATKPTQQRVINDWCAQQDGGRFISFGGIHPDAEDYEQEIAHIKELGLHGIKLHPDYQGFIIDDERMDKIYDAIERAALAALCFIFPFGTQFSVIGIFLAAAALYGGYYLTTKLDVEYEYITNGEIDVDKITAQRSRKRLITFRCGSATDFGIADENSLCQSGANRSCLRL